MNAIVEVVTARVSAQTSRAVVIMALLIPQEVPVLTTVATSALRVLSMGGHSISAVAPDADFISGGVAVA